jgi:hypothetical protein
MSRNKKATKAAAPAPIEEPIDIEAQVKGRIARRWPRIAGGLAALLLVLGLIDRTSLLWKPALSFFDSPVTIVEVKPVFGAPDTFDVSVRNTLPEPALLSAIEVKVEAVTLSQETFGGSSSLPLPGHYHAILEPHPGYIARASVSPAQIPPNALDHFQIRLVTKPSGRVAVIEYQLKLRLRVNGNEEISSERFAATMLVYQL